MKKQTDNKPTVRGEIEDYQKFYRVVDDTVSNIVFETKEEALEYVGDCLDGRTPYMPIKVMVINMTKDEFNQLKEFEG